MKKGIVLLLGIGLLRGTSSFALDSLTTFKWAYDEGLIQKDSFLGGLHLTRQEIAPILVQYLSKVAKKDYQSRECKAKDLYDAELRFQKDLQTLCSYGIFQGHRNLLHPKRTLTNAQAVALVMRIADGFQNPWKKGQHRAVNYFQRAKELGFEAILPIFHQKNGLVKGEDFINFLYSTAHPHQKIDRLEEQHSDWTAPKGGFKSSDDALRKLAEILAS